MAATSVAMSAGISSSFSSLKKMDAMPGSLQQARAVELKGVAGKAQRSRASRGQRVRVASVRNVAPELVEMEPASQGSQLLGEVFLSFLSRPFGLLFPMVVRGRFFLVPP